MDEKSRYAVIILAAGESRRMGQPKQLLAVEGVPLLQRVAGAAVDAQLGIVQVVLGANVEKIRPVLADLPLKIVINSSWAEGMGASLRAGMDAILDELPVLRGVIVVLGDQPAISAAHLSRLAQVHRTSGKTIVASRCAGKLSPPVLFGPAHFSALRVSRGDAGARALLQANPDQIAAVETDALVDLDTVEDYAAFLKRQDESRLK